MRIISTLTLPLIGTIFSLAAQAAPLNVCHIANAGFLVGSKDTAFVVDAVMAQDNYEGRFALPSANTLNSLQNATGAFQNVKLALVTHRHGDHFDAAASLQHLRSNEDVEYIMPPEAFQMLVDAGLTEANRSRVHSILPDWKSGPHPLSVNSIPVEVYRIDHGPDMPQNLGYKVTLDGQTIFHTGDINAPIERLLDAGLDHTPVDIMLMPFWNILERKDTIQRAWEIKTMVPMHYHAQAQSWMEQYGGPVGLRAKTEALWPNSARIDQEMQCQPLGSQ